jgi:hypothetical protein
MKIVRSSRPFRCISEIEVVSLRGIASIARKLRTSPTYKKLRICKEQGNDYPLQNKKKLTSIPRNAHHCVNMFSAGIP